MNDEGPTLPSQVCTKRGTWSRVLCFRHHAL